MKQRNTEYEQKFKKYLFSFDFKTHLEICKNINVHTILPDKEKRKEIYGEGF